MPGVTALESCATSPGLAVTVVDISHSSRRGRPRPSPTEVSIGRPVLASTRLPTVTEAVPALRTAKEKKPAPRALIVPVQTSVVVVGVVVVGVVGVSFFPHAAPERAAIKVKKPKRRIMTATTGTR